MEMFCEKCGRQVRSVLKASAEWLGGDRIRVDLSANCPECGTRLDGMTHWTNMNKHRGWTE